MQIKTKIVSSHTADSKPVKQEVNITVILPPLVFPAMTIINDNSRVVNKLETSLTEYTRVVIYDCHMFIVQATDS